MFLLLVHFLCIVFSCLYSYLLLPYLYECRSRTGSSQPEAIPIEKINVPVKIRAKKKKKESADMIPIVPLDSPAMGTRSKIFNPASPAMSTRSKRDRKSVV